VRGEEVVIQANVFNYMGQDLDVSLHVYFLKTYTHNKWQTTWLMTFVDTHAKNAISLYKYTIMNISVQKFTTADPNVTLC
jgi:hypothetical protein